MATRLEFWGVPSDTSHDPDAIVSRVRRMAGGEGGPSCPSSAPKKPFFRTPTACTASGEALQFDIRGDSWQHPGDFVSSSFRTHEGPGYPEPRDKLGSRSGDRRLRSGSLRTDAQRPADDRTRRQPDRASPSTSACRATAGTRSRPAAEVEAAICQSDMRSADVTLPKGVSLNPAVGRRPPGLHPRSGGGDQPARLDADRIRQRTGHLSQRLEDRRRRNHHALAQQPAQRRPVPRRAGRKSVQIPGRHLPRRRRARRADQAGRRDRIGTGRPCHHELRPGATGPVLQYPFRTLRRSPRRSFARRRPAAPTRPRRPSRPGPGPAPCSASRPSRSPNAPTRASTRSSKPVRRTRSPAPPARWNFASAAKTAPTKSPASAPPFPEGVLAKLGSVSLCSRGHHRRDSDRGRHRCRPDRVTLLSRFESRRHHHRSAPAQAPTRSTPAPAASTSPGPTKEPRTPWSS